MEFRVHHTFIGNIELLVAFYCFTILQLMFDIIQVHYMKKSAAAYDLSLLLYQNHVGDVELKTWSSTFQACRLL